MSVQIKKRDVGLDLLRAICTIYIAGFWHLLSYTDAYQGYDNPITLRLTCIILGTFIFISGYFVGAREKRTGSKVLTDFYRKRFLRIFPLYAGAVSVFWLLRMSGGTESLKALLLVSMFMKPAPVTLWFITMLMVFYLISPLILAHIRKGRIRGVILASIITASVLLVYDWSTGLLDFRILLYFPAFLAGMIFGVGERKNTGKWLVPSILLVAGIAISFIRFSSGSWDWLTFIPMVVGGATVLFMLASGLKIRSRLISHLIYLTSYSSYCVFLFHRPIYGIITRLYFPETGSNQLIFLVGICLPFVFVSSYLIQKVYDSLIERLGAGSA